MQVFVKTDIGKARDNNQDFYYISNSGDVPEVYILADGMGGYQAGDYASWYAVEGLVSYMKEQKGNSGRDPFSGGNQPGKRSAVPKSTE